MTFLESLGRILRPRRLKTGGDIETSNPTEASQAARHPAESSKPAADDEQNSAESFDSNADEACTDLWKIYVNQVIQNDVNMWKERKEDMDNLLIFSALFSGILTAFTIESYKALQRDSAQDTVHVLIQISQQLNGTAVFEPLPTFKPPVSALVCNILWFLSFVLALTCSFLATLVQQQARNFINNANSGLSPIHKARFNAFLHAGHANKYQTHHLVDIIPTLLHLSLFLFLGGLVVFLFPVNWSLAMIISILVLGPFLIVYSTLTIFPLFFLATSVYTPFSNVSWRLKTMCIWVWTRRDDPAKTLEKAVLNQVVTKSQERDVRDKWAMYAMIKSLTNNGELQTFIEAIPHSVYNSYHNKVREQNIKLFMPLLYGSEQNIWSFIGKFVAKSEGWADDFRTQCARACARAIWALVWVYVTQTTTVDSVDQAAKQQKHFLQFAQSMPSLLKILAANNDDDIKSKLCSALMALGIQWLDMPDLLANWATAEQNPILSIFQLSVSPYADELKISDASLDMILAALGLQAELDLASGTPTKGSLDIINIKNAISGSKAMHIIRNIILANYIAKFPSPNPIPTDFEKICQAIHPWPRSPFEVNDLNLLKLSPLLHHKNVLPALKRHFDEKPGSALDKHTDALIRWSLRIPLHYKDVSGCRQFVLEYFHKKHQDDPSALDAWKGEDLERVGQYVLKEMQSVNSEQFDICMDISVFLLASASHSPNKREFYTGLFGILPTLPSSDAERKKKYLLLKTLLDLVVCIRLVPPSEFYEPLPKNSDSELATGEVAVPYLHWELSRLNTLDKASFRDTLAVAIVSRYIELRRKNELSPRDGILKKLGYALSVKPKVEEDVQVMFAENVAKLWQTGPETESVKSTLLDVIGFVNCWGLFSSEWITSQPAAKILSGLNGLSELEKLDSRMKITVRPWSGFLSYCREMAGPNSNVPSGSTNPFRFDCS